MKKLLLSIGLVTILIFRADAAVLVTTGVNADGTAYVDLPEIAMEITVTLSTSSWFLVFADAYNPAYTTGGYAIGRGLSVSTPTGSHALSSLGPTPRSQDGALASFSSLSLVKGQTYVVKAGRFQTSGPLPDWFVMFPSGQYEIYLQDFGANERILSAPAQAVPEPSSLAMMGVGFVLLAALRLRTSRSS